MNVKRYSFSPVAVVTQRGANGYFVQCELGVTEYPLGNAGDYVLSTDFDAVVKERDALQDRLAEAEAVLRAVWGRREGSDDYYRGYLIKYREVS